MQRFNAPLTLEDKKVARRIGRAVFMTYSVIAFALTAAVVAHLAFKNPTRADAAAEASEKIEAVGPHSEAPVGFARSAPGFEPRKRDVGLDARNASPSHVVTGRGTPARPGSHSRAARSQLPALAAAS